MPVLKQQRPEIADDPIELYDSLDPVSTESPARSYGRYVIAGALALATLAALVIVPRITADRTSAVPLVTVERGDIARTITATGKLQALQTVEVGSQVSGTIKSLFVDFNDRVRKGQVIAQLDPEQFQAQLNQANANLMAAQSGVTAAQSAIQSGEANVQASEANRDRAKAAMEDARATAARNAELFKAGVLARQAYETSQAAAAQAEAQYNQAVAQVNQVKSQLTGTRAQLQQAQAQAAQARAAVQLASVNLSHTTITAPVDGVVVARNVNVGQTVAASLQAPTLFIIANDLSRMQVLADIDEADVGQLAPDSRVMFTVDAFPRDTFQGRISQIRLNPQTVQNVVTYTAVIDVDNPDLKLRPGMTANVTAIVAEAKDVLKVPNTALRYRPEGAADQQPAARPNRRSDAGPRVQTVYRMNAENKLEAVKVQLGLSDGVNTAALSGINEGDRIAVAQALQGAGARPQGGNFLFGRPAQTRRAR